MNLDFLMNYILFILFSIMSIIKQFEFKNIHIIPLAYTSRKTLGFSMIIPSTEKRVNVLFKLLNFTFFDPPKYLSEIIISWGHGNTEMVDNLVNNFSQVAQRSSILLRYTIPNDKSLARRFHDADNIQTSTVLSIDDDILMPKENIEYGYEIWQKHPTQLVGYLARYLGIQKANFSDQRDILKYEVPGSFNKIRLILTNVAFMSRDLALSYYSPENELNVNLVRTMNNCEDILMNYVAMNRTNLSAVFVLKPYEHIGTVGLSTNSRVGHFNNRTICVNKFYESFGRYPPIIPKDCLYL